MLSRAALGTGGKGRRPLLAHRKSPTVPASSGPQAPPSLRPPRAGDPGGRQRSGLLHFLLRRISPAHRSPCWPASQFAARARCPIRSPCPQGPPLISQPRSARRSQRYQSNENMVFRKVSLDHAASPTHERPGAEAGFPQGARARGCAWTFSPEQQARDPPWDAVRHRHSHRENLPSEWCWVSAPGKPQGG
jgi:hypothetical protein